MKNKSIFKSYEIHILNSLFAKLSDEIAAKIMKQFESISYIQRIANGYDVNFYTKGILKNRRLECEEISFMPEETLLATFTPDNENSQSTLKAELWYIKGRPFAIEFAGRGNLTEIYSWRCQLLYDFAIK